MRLDFGFIAAFVGFFLVTGCSSSGTDANAGGGGATATGGAAQGGSGAIAGGGATASGGGGATGSGGSAGGCSVVESHVPDAGIHVTECSHIDYSTNPPSSGQHYPVWCEYHSYDAPVPRGYWVHGLEHGAIAITYNCAGGCAGEVAEVQAFIDALPVDPRCSAVGLTHQVIMTPDPLLDVRWAMSSWGYTLRASCVDLAAFGQFYADHLGHAPEDSCANLVPPPVWTATCGQ